MCQNLFLCRSMYFFKQKTAYEMRISDWSADVCSSDLRTIECWYLVVRTKNRLLGEPGTSKALRTFLHHILRTQNTERRRESSDLKIGRAQYRERVCQYV